jgi:micrococcal nuclease
MANRYRSRSPRRKKAAYKWAVVFLLVALIVGFRLVEHIGVDRLPGERFIVARIIDGDTVELRGGDRLRLLSIDTPEKGELFYDEACAFLDSLTLGKMARIVFTGRRRDKYGRLLGYLYIDSIFVNKVILERGLGFLYFFDDTEFNRPEISQLFAAQRNALRERVGIWSIEREPEPYYVAVKGSFRFHRPGCRYIKQFSPDHHRTFPTREDALYEGLSPCRRCRP